MTKAEVLSWLKENGSPRNVAGMARYGIVAPKAFGVTMAAMLKFAKKREKDHALAAALWKTGWYEARILASMLDDPKGSLRNKWTRGRRNSTTGHLRHRLLASLLRHTLHLGKGAEMVEVTERVRQTRRLRDDGGSRDARSHGRRCGIQDPLSADRGGRAR